MLPVLKSLDIDVLPSPNGALLRYDCRMVAMILLNGGRLIVSPPDGDDREFELPAQREAAIAFIEHLRDRLFVSA